MNFFLNIPAAIKAYFEAEPDPNNDWSAVGNAILILYILFLFITPLIIGVRLYKAYSPKKDNIETRIAGVVILLITILFPLFILNASGQHYRNSQRSLKESAAKTLQWEKDEIERQKTALQSSTKPYNTLPNKMSISGNEYTREKLTYTKDFDGKLRDMVEAKYSNSARSGTVFLIRDSLAANNNPQLPCGSQESTCKDVAVNSTNFTCRETGSSVDCRLDQAGGRQIQLVKYTARFDDEFKTIELLNFVAQVPARDLRFDEIILNQKSNTLRN